MPHGELVSTAGDNLLLRRAHRVKSYARQLWRTGLVSRSRQNKKANLKIYSFSVSSKLVGREIWKCLTFTI